MQESNYFKNRLLVNVLFSSWALFLTVIPRDLQPEEVNYSEQFTYNQDTCCTRSLAVFFTLKALDTIVKD